jgi:cytochrome c oxidase subunit 3/cytochrome o ubiquinol oxidase subunit 3
VTATETSEAGIPVTETPAGPAHITDKGGHAAPPTSTGITNEKLAMWAFLGSECLLFGALIATYFLYRNRANGTVRPGDVYDIPFTSVSSFILLMSSLTMVLALAGFQRGDLRRGRIWLLCTALLGSGFIGGQVYEFTIFIHKGMTIKSNPASSAFFVLTGFHGTHVAIGVIMLLTLVFMSLKGRIPQERSEIIEIAGLYWHFVDVVWIVVFTVVYLLPGNR